jgi:pyruvate decarboxylase
MVQEKVEGERLDQPIDLTEPSNEPEKEDYVVDVVMKYLRAAKRPIILADACSIRHRVLKEVHDLVETTKLPVFVTPMGKGAVNETHPNYGGVYAGDGSHPDVKEAVNEADLILSIGALKVSSSELSHFCRLTTDAERLQYVWLHLPNLSTQHHRPSQ